MQPPAQLGLLCALALGACGGDDASKPSGGPCTDTALTYRGFGKAFLDKYCASCHGGSHEGAARMGAPPGAVFDTLALVQRNAAQMRLEVVTTKEMPFGEQSLKPSDDERTRFGEWLDCGAPE